LVGTNTVGTVLNDMVNNYSSVAMRKSFQVPPEQIAAAEFFLRLRFNNGFCAYVNGVEFARENCPDTVQWDGIAPAPLSTEGAYVVPSELIREGENTLAIVGFNASKESSDFEVSAELFSFLPGTETVELVPNTGFEKDTEPWIIDGT
jgi:hypothetical protein